MSTYRIFHIRIFTFIFCGLHCSGEYTDFITLLWLKASQNMDPAEVWHNDGSIYNDATNKTFQTLVAENTPGYRNTIIDSWATRQPDRVRVSYLNPDGYRLSAEEFNSTGSSMTDWFATERASSSSDYVFNRTFTSYRVSFSNEDMTWGVRRYQSVVIPNYNGTTLYLVHNKGGTLLLPAQVLNETSRCYLSYTGSNPFALNITTTNLFHEYCSALCRERNYPTAAAHDTICSCMSESASGPALNACNTTCEGDTSQTCGGIHPSFPPPGFILFDEVLTGIDVTQFDRPLLDQETVTVNGLAEHSHTKRRYVYGYKIAIPTTTTVPMEMTMEIIFRAENCSSFTLGNSTLNVTFTLPETNLYYLTIDPIYTQCTHITLYDVNSNILTFPVNVTTVALQDNKFLTASIIAVEAAWQIEPVTDQCECECWVHNLLYGDSPYNNLTYSEIEDALRNVTEKLERELAVNKSTLSSTIRSKTSAEDDRTSATAVGYTLGVALLTLSIGGIVLADVPKLMRNLHLMRENFQTRFCRKKTSSPPDVTITDPSDETSMVT